MSDLFKFYLEVELSARTALQSLMVVVLAALLAKSASSAIRRMCSWAILVRLISALAVAISWQAA